MTSSSTTAGAFQEARLPVQAKLAAVWTSLMFLYIPASMYNADGEPWSYSYFYGLSIGLEVLLLAFILRAAWTWPRTIRATAGRDLAPARV